MNNAEYITLFDPISGYEYVFGQSNGAAKLVSRRKTTLQRASPKAVVIVAGVSMTVEQLLGGETMHVTPYQVDPWEDCDICNEPTQTFPLED